MGRFWVSSQAPAYVASVVLLGGLFHACSLNPQPAPPAKDELHDPTVAATSGGNNGSISSSAATSTTGTMGGAPIFDPSVTATTSGTTGGAGVDINGDGVIDEADNESPEGATAGGAAMGGGGMMSGAAGAAGAAGEEPSPPPANAR